MATQKEFFEFKYQGDIEAIDINTLVNSQLQYSYILNEIKNQLFPDIDLKIRVQSFEKGSFDINQIIEVSIVTGTLIFENREYIKEIFKILKLYLDIKKILGDKKPDKVTDIETNKVELAINVPGDNNIIIVDKEAFNLYQTNYTIHRALYKNGQILIKDNEIEGIQVIEKKNSTRILDIPRDEFKYLSTTNAYISKELNEDIREDAVLYIKKFDVNPEKKSRWDFIFEGKILHSVSISDNDFLRRVKEGEKFGNGDRLRCRLKTIQKLDIETGAYLDSKYEILNVMQVIPRNEQFIIQPD
jgi:hypothetical protein